MQGAHETPVNGNLVFAVEEERSQEVDAITETILRGGALSAIPLASI